MNFLWNRLIGAQTTRNCGKINLNSLCLLSEITDLVLEALKTSARLKMRNSELDYSYACNEKGSNLKTCINPPFARFFINFFCKVYSDRVFGQRSLSYWHESITCHYWQKQNWEIDAWCFMNSNHEFRLVFGNISHIF